MAADTPTTRRLQAIDSANRLRREMGIDPTERLDVFGLVETLGLWLVFMPLEGLLGAYLPEGTGGVMVTTQRDVTIQRYTAAHELGHWRLDHGNGALDTEEHILGADTDESERLAQLFAGHLLAPAGLVSDILARSPRPGDVIDPVRAYTVAREAGISYEAAVRQMHNLGFVNTASRNKLLQADRLKTKSAVAGGRRPVNGRANVWPLDPRWDHQSITIDTEDEIVLALPENPSTGHRWMPAGTSRQLVIQPPPPIPDGALAPVPAKGLLAGRKELTGRPVRPVVLERLRKQAKDPPSSVDQHGATWNPPARGVPAEVVGDIRLSDPADPPDPRRHRSDRLARIAGNRPGHLTVGSASLRVVGIYFPTAGVATVSWEYRSPYSATEPAEEFTVEVTVRGRRDGFSLEQIGGDASWVADARMERVAARVAPHD